MKQFRARVTSKGQVTIPADVRRLLGISTPDNVAFVAENGHVEVKRVGSVVESTAGALRINGPKLSAREEREATERAIAEDVVERMAR